MDKLILAQAIDVEIIFYVQFIKLAVMFFKLIWYKLFTYLIWLIHLFILLLFNRQKYGGPKGVQFDEYPLKHDSVFSNSETNNSD